MKVRVGTRGRRGVALLYAVLASFVAATMVTLSLGLSIAADKKADTKQRAAQAQYLADGAIEAAKKQLQTAIANWDSIPSAGSVTIDGHTANFEVRSTGFTDTTADAAGIQTLVNGYEVRAFSNVDGRSAQSFRVINSQATPLFQFAVFYTDDLEINPGPSMTLGGRVHSNQNMYLGSDNTLTVNTNYVHAVGSIFRSRKDDPNASSGTVNIRKWVENPWNAAEPSVYTTMYSKSQLTNLGVTSVGGYDSRFTTGFDQNGDGDYGDTGDFLPFGPGALAYWGAPSGYLHGDGHTVETGQHDIGEAVVPQIGSISMYEPMTGGDYALDPTTHQYVPCAPGTGTHTMGYYHEHADLSILVSASGTTWKAYDSAGVDITASLGTSAVKIKTIYDARQANGGAGNTKILDIDIQALNATGKFPANGLLYAAHYGEGTGTNAKGVRLKNGAVLPKKLTVVSEDPLYVQGDYNVGDATHPKVGAAVIGDAVNLLSNAWNDTKTNTSGLPNATNTTYNMAMISGNQDSSPGHYNGGLENLPRFHENWSGKTCKVRGSFVNTWNSRHATSPWVYGANRYQAPTRDWAYDTAFNSVLNLPPFTPMAVSAQDVVSW